MPSTPAADLHESLLEGCEVCAREWRRLGALRTTYLQLLDSLDREESESASDDEIDASEKAVELSASRLAELGRLYVNARNERNELARCPASRRAGLIRGAWARFRSPLVAQLLIRRSIELLRSDPASSAEIASLVEDVLGWTLDGEEGPPVWATSLIALGYAHKSNALRVKGDFPAAESAFAAMYRRLAGHPLDALATAEVASLEASLAIDLRRPEWADECLDRAVLYLRVVNDEERLAKVAIQRANLAQRQGRSQEVLELLDLDSPLFSPVRNCDLYLMAATAIVNAYCDLDQTHEAANVLAASLEHFERSDHSIAGAICRGLQGRVALGLGRTSDAERLFKDAHDAMLSLGRYLDAAAYLLYLADALQAAGKHDSIVALSRNLVPTFRGYGAETETLAALQLFVHAARHNALTAETIEEVRQRLVAR